MMHYYIGTTFPSIHEPKGEMSEGCNIEEVFPEKLQALEKYGLVEVTDSEVALTELRKFFADEVAQQFQSENYMHYPREEYGDGPLCPYSEGRN